MVATTNSPEREMILIKIDLNGNLIWQSDNTLLEEPKAYDTRLSVDSNGDPILAVYGFIGSDPYTSDLVTYRFSKEEGRSIKIPDYEALQNIDTDFKMIDYDHNPYPHMFVTEENGVSHIIRLHEDYQCFGGNTKTTELSTSINLSAIGNRASLTDQGILTGTYEFTSEPTTIEWSELCPPFPPKYDLLKDDTTACQDLSLVLDLNDIPYDIIWEDGSTSKTRNITNSGLYSYEVDHCGLEYSEEIDVTLEDCSCDIQVPTIFSPNGDKKNDDFKLITECKHLESLEINILDRWGNLIYTHNGTDYNWDGTLNGQKLSEDVYVYQIEYKVISNTQWQLLTGTIALVR